MAMIECKPYYTSAIAKPVQKALQQIEKALANIAESVNYADPANLHHISAVCDYNKLCTIELALREMML